MQWLFRLLIFLIQPHVLGDKFAHPQEHFWLYTVKKCSWGWANLSPETWGWIKNINKRKSRCILLVIYMVVLATVLLLYVHTTTVSPVRYTFVSIFRFITFMLLLRTPVIDIHIIWTNSAHPLQILRYPQFVRTKILVHLIIHLCSVTCLFDVRLP